MSHKTCYCHVSAKNQYAPQIPHIRHVCQLVHVHITDSYVSTYASCKLNAINNVTSMTDINSFHTIDIWHRKNIPPTSHTYVPLHHHCGLHIDAMLLYMQVQKMTICNRYSTHILPNIWQKTYAPQMPHIHHICKFIHVQISANYVSLYATYVLDLVAL